MAQPQAAAPLLNCEEADKELARRRNAIDAAARQEIVACSDDRDCTSWSPRFECPTNGVASYPPTAAVAVGKVDAAQRQIDALEAELCERIMPGCRATGDLALADLRCVPGECRFTPRTGP